MMSIEQAAINLAVAFCLSAIIGFERQWRNRLAGLRTNTLVALGAASFVMFAALAPEEASPTRVAAQVVSGIGFLGAGLSCARSRRSHVGQGLPSICIRSAIRFIANTPVAHGTDFDQPCCRGAWWRWCR